MNYSHSFESGIFPLDWGQFTSSCMISVAATPTLTDVFSGTYGLNIQPSSSSGYGWAWYTGASSADVRVSSTIYLSSVNGPVMVFGRGSGLDTITPTFYCLSGTRGMRTADGVWKIYKVESGVAQAVASLPGSSTFISSVHIKATLFMRGTSLKASIFIQSGANAGKYLDASGVLVEEPSWCVEVDDSSITGSGLCGVGHVRNGSPGWSLSTGSSTVGNVPFDNMAIDSADTPSVPIISHASYSLVAAQSRVAVVDRPAVGIRPIAIVRPSSPFIPEGFITLEAAVTAVNDVESVKWMVDGVERGAYSGVVEPATTGKITGPFRWTFDTLTCSNGTHTVECVVRDIAGNTASSVKIIQTSNVGAVVRPSIAHAYNHIYTGTIAYSSHPLGSVHGDTAQQTTEVDLIGKFDTFNINQGLTGHAYQHGARNLVCYVNVSNVYFDAESALGGGPFLDWLSYADDNGLDRESAFYHVAANKTVSDFGSYGTSGDGQSVRRNNKFWKVWVSTSGDSVFSDKTLSAYDATTADVTLGSTINDSLYLGWPDLFNEVNVEISTAGSSYAFSVEYSSAVDGSKNVTAWTDVSGLTDGTAGGTVSGAVTWTLPSQSQWKSGKVNNSLRMRWVRLQVTGGNAPIFSSVKGRDYATFNDVANTISIPAYDAARPWESRLTYGNYGQQRLAINPANPNAKAWARDYLVRFYNSLNNANGLFVDNQGASPNPSVISNDVLGSEQDGVTNYAEHFGKVLGAAWMDLPSGSFLMPNYFGTAGAEKSMAYCPCGWEEFFVDPLRTDISGLQDKRLTVAKRRGACSPAPMLMLDSYSFTYGSYDNRIKMAVLTMYYMLSQVGTYIWFFAGENPSRSWADKWIAAAEYDVGAPVDETYSILESGDDPSDPSNFRYTVVQRLFQNARVLYKPMSENKVSMSPSTIYGDTTQTVHSLGGTYRQVLPDGTLGAAVTSVSLKNAEGVILVAGS